mmetsp:Transcript_5612/g.13001  ORF Transcript_5612/g.13001 Transcript_5612/m.13001 type:complete len:820 (+) Transcript_5612:244-2703(+)
MASTEAPSEHLQETALRKESEGNELGKTNSQSQLEKYPVRETVCGQLRFNWLVTFSSLALLWGISIYCMTSPEAAMVTLGEWYSDCILYFTWFYILGNPIMTFFTFYIAWRYGHIKLGPKNAEPEFSDMTYFAMLFSAGVGVGLFFFGVSEPLFHLTGNRYDNPGYHSEDEMAAWSLTISLYHWGIAAWSPYLVLAMSAGLASYSFGLPLTVRSSFYPLIGNYCWGWIGDVIDSWAIVMTVAGICTSLGLGAIQMSVGLQMLGWVEEVGDSPEVLYVTIVWIVTAFATLSVISGLGVGIKYLSQAGFLFGCLILFLCFTMEKSYYLLNVLVQSTGDYLQWCIFQVPFYTDAFAGLKEGEGRASDGKSAPAAWMGWWTVFYMAWWVSWSCFVGLFIARISKNRKLRSVIVGCVICPTIYAILWFGTFGGIGIRQARQAAELQALGETHYGSSDYFQSSGSEKTCYDVPQSDVVVNGTTVFTNTLPGVTPVCLFDSNNSESAWFNVMNSFSFPNGDSSFAGFGPFLSGISIIALAIYFVTSSDSGSLVVDTLASNGSLKHHWSQRVFWAFTEGAVATGLLMAGGNDALTSLQAASIVFGLPFNFFLIFMCYGIIKMCRVLEARGSDEGMTDARVLLPDKDWTLHLCGGVFNVIEWVLSFGHISKELQGFGVVPDRREIAGFFFNLFLPFVSLHAIYAALDPGNNRHIYRVLVTSVYTLLFLAWIALFICGTINKGFTAFAWTAFFVNSCILTSLRMDVRSKFGLEGTIVGDFIAASFLYPQGLLQMQIQILKEDDEAGEEGEDKPLAQAEASACEKTEHMA